MKNECCVCRRLQPDLKRCEVLTLTPEEKKAVADSGTNPVPDKLIYCHPCWKIVNDKQRGARFLQGLWETGLRRAGVADAEARAKKFHDALIAKGKP